MILLALAPAVGTFIVLVLYTSGAWKPCWLRRECATPDEPATPPEYPETVYEQVDFHCRTLARVTPSVDRIRSINTQ